MRILFISPNPIWGGAATANISFAKMLLDNGHHVFYSDEYFSSNIFNGVEITHYPYHGNKFKSKKLFYQQIDLIKPEIIIWIPMVAIYYAQEISSLSRNGIKQFVIMHSLSLLRDVKGRLMDYLISKVIARMDSIIFVSDYTRKSWLYYSSVRKSRANKIVINNISINQSVIRHDIGSPVRVGFVGRFSDEKQPELFCHLSENSNFEFHAWGDGPLLEKMKLLYPRVKYHGLETDLNKIYKNIDILLLTSKFENCPMVVLEAKSFGVPCVAPNVGGIPEIVVHQSDGYLFDLYDECSIIKGIEHIIDSYSIYSKHSLVSSYEFSPETIYKKWKMIL